MLKAFLTLFALVSASETIKLDPKFYEFFDWITE